MIAQGVIKLEPSGSNLLGDFEAWSKNGSESCKKEQEKEKETKAFFLSFFLSFSGGLPCFWQGFPLDKLFFFGRASLCTRFRVDGRMTTVPG